MLARSSDCELFVARARVRISTVPSRIFVSFLFLKLSPRSFQAARFPFSRLLRAASRHLFSIFQGEKKEARKKEREREGRLSAAIFSLWFKNDENAVQEN